MVIKDIKNCKIRVESEEHSKAIQEAAFKLGFEWRNGLKRVLHVNSIGLFFYDDMEITKTGDHVWFKSSGHKEIFFYDNNFHDEPQSTTKAGMKAMDSAQKLATEMSERDVCDVVEHEWVNGDECIYKNDKETIYTYVGMHPHGDGHYIFNDEKGITYVANGYLHEPLTPEQKEEKARLESAIELHDVGNDAYFKGEHRLRSDWHDSDQSIKDMWLAIVDKTGYRKGEL